MPADGVRSKTPTYEDLVENLDKKPGKTNPDEVRKLLEGFKK